jgi:hypothetical protein
VVGYYFYFYKKNGGEVWDNYGGFFLKKNKISNLSWTILHTRCIRYLARKQKCFICAKHAALEYCGGLS